MRLLALFALALLAVAAVAAVAAPRAAAADPLAALAVQQAELTATDGATGDALGYWVAIDGDTAVVGAETATVGGNVVQGAAYVFTRSNGVWTQQQKLTASDGSEYAFFGDGVALEGDTALIGAPGMGVPGLGDQGAAYVFTRSNGVWTQQQKLTANDGAAGDYFGHSIALGDDTALIGASGATVVGHTYQGAAYVFTRSNGVWTQQQKLTANDGAAGDNLGCAVALSDDTALIGATNATVGGNTYQGAAYIFTSSNGAWSQQQKLTAIDGAADEFFGQTVALDGDTALVGADATVDGNSEQGAAYLYTRSNGAWSQQQKLTAIDGAAGDYFGYAVALDSTTALVGAVSKDVHGNLAAGAAYIFGLPVTVTPSVSGGHGGISPSSAQAYAQGSTPTFTFTPDAGYKTGEVLVDGAAVTPTTADSYTFPALAGDHTISVGFTPAVGPSITVKGAVSGWSRRAVTLRFTAVPSLGGAAVGHTEYRLDGGAWRSAARVRITRQGVTRVACRAVDVNGTAGPARTLRVRIDTRRPMVEARAAVGLTRSVVRLRYRVADHIPGSGRALVRLVVVGASGRALTRASTLPATTNAWHRVRVKTRTLAPGVYTVVLRAVDLAGNFQRGVTRTTLTVR